MKQATNKGEPVQPPSSPPTLPLNQPSLKNMKIGKLKQLTLKYAEILKPVSVLDADSTLAGVWVLPSPGLSSSPLGLVAKPRSRRPGLELVVSKNIQIGL